MKVSVILPTVTVFVTLLIKEGLGLECYVCNSYLSKKCAAEDKSLYPEFLTKCEGNATGCRKLDLEAYYEKGYHSRIVRQCSYEQEAPQECIRRTGTYRYVVHYCHCDEEGCNSAVLSVASVTLMSVALFLAHIAGKHL